ncbi:MAG: hypothetical protein PVH24_07985 [Candidatus Zixiibacteriota bacterium]|jgi:hypothetical protein
MNCSRFFIAVMIVVFLGFVSCTQETQQAPTTDLSLSQIEGDNYTLEPAYLVTMHVPNADVDRVLESVAEEVGLFYGRYDNVAYLDAAGLEQYRPLEGSKGGAMDSAWREPTTRVHFSVPRDEKILRRALNAAHSAHSYEEPVFYITEVWRTLATNPDDSNPNRWWNQ